MSTSTSNLGLVKPDGPDRALVAVINENMNKIDQYAGEVNDSLGAVEDGMAIVADGNTHAAITSGQFVYVRNHSTLTQGLYTATANIAANATLSTSNLTADPSGGLNALNNNLTSLSDQIANLLSPSAYTAPTNLATGVTIVEGGYIKIGKLVVANCRMTLSSNIQSANNIAKFPAAGLSYSHVSVTNNKKVDIGIDAYGNLVAGEAVSSGTLIITSVYFSL